MSIQPKQTDQRRPPDSNDTERLPAPDDVPNDQTAVRNLRGGPKQRKNAVRIRLPRDPDKREELPADIYGMLLWIITDICGEGCIAGVEILMFTGPDGLEFVIHPRPSTLDGQSDTQSRLDSFTKKGLLAAGEQTHTGSQAPLSSNGHRRNRPPRSRTGRDNGCDNNTTILD